MSNTVVELPSLQGGSDSATSTSATGYVTGGGLSPSDNRFHATLWDPQNAVTDLGTWSGSSCLLTGGVCPTTAWGVDSCGMTVVGSAQVDFSTSPADTRAMLFHNNNVYDLNTRITSTDWTLYAARSINDAGVIVGYGIWSGGSGIRAFRLVPT